MTKETPITEASVTATPTPEAKPAESVTAAPAVPESDKPAEQVFTKEQFEHELGKRLAREARKRERELEATVRTLQAAQVPAQAKAEPPTDSGAPKRDDFDSYEDYIRADARYVAKQEFQSQREAQVRAESEAKARAEREASVKTFDERIKAAAAKYGDFEEVFESAKAANITNAMFDAITATEEGAEIVYHFGKHPEEAQRIASLSPKAQAVEIGKLAVRIADGVTAPANPAAAPAPKPAPVSKAPEPIKPVGGSATVEKPWQQLTDKEFAERRKKQIAQRR